MMDIQDKHYAEGPGYRARLDCWMGDDEMIVRKNRTSVEKPGLKRSSTRTAIRRMIRKFHTSAIEQAVASFEIWCPIFIARQFFRHRTFSYNEISYRYTDARDVEIEVYMPEQFRAQDPIQHQGSSGYIDAGDALKAPSIYLNATKAALDAMFDLADMGVENGQARGTMPVSCMTHFHVTGNLHNWLHFLWLRDSPHAQEEIRHLAHAIRGMLATVFPEVMSAFTRYRMEAETLHQGTIEALRGIMADLAPHLIEELIEHHVNIHGDGPTEKREMVEQLTKLLSC